MLVVLKIIGIIVLCAIVLAAVLLLLGLFYPVHYRTNARINGSLAQEWPSFDSFLDGRSLIATEKWNAGSRIADFIQLFTGKNDLESKITLHAWWLFHLLALDAKIEEKVLEYSVKLAGLTIMKDTVEDVEILRPSLEALFRDPEKTASSRNPEKTASVQEQEETTSFRDPEKTASSRKPENATSDRYPGKDASFQMENCRVEEKQPAGKTIPGAESAQSVSINAGSRAKNNNPGPRAVIRQFIKDIRIAGIKISTIRTISETQLGRRAIHSLKTQGKELLKAVKPYIIKGYLRYGLADAAQTAFLYGLLAQKVYEVAGDGVEVQMDFFETGLDLDVDADGKFALKPVLPIVFRLVEDKDVETFLRSLKIIIDG